MKPTYKNTGFALADLILVVVAAGILSGLALPLIQATREETRLVACGNNLRQIGRAAYSYSDAREILPMASLSFKGTLKQKQWSNAKDPQFYLHQQWTSTIAMVSPYMNEPRLRAILDQVDPLFFDYEKTVAGVHESFHKLEGFESLVYHKIPLYTCPSDNEEVRTRQVFTLFPTYDNDLADDQDDDPWYGYWAGWKAEDEYNNTDLPARANYMACAGVNLGGQNRTGDSAKFRGMLGLREKTTLKSISRLDGLSNTLMMGESVGEINLQNMLPTSHPKYDPASTKTVRRLTQTWNQGCFVRGRGDVRWKAEPPLGPSGDPRNTMIGNSIFADIKGFSSFHRQGMVALLGDGSVRVVPRSIDWQAWYAICGSRDGRPIQPNVMKKIQLLNPKDKKKRLKKQ